jgi:prepilin-type N-terminal cleavage/methylation domain-containing protein
MKAPRLERFCRQGFTLVEMLVVVTIIAVLAGLLMPQIGRMKEKGRRAVCSSNLRQIHTLIETYMKDFDDCFPFYDVDGNGGSSQNAPTLLDENTNMLMRRGYTRNVKVFQCPSRVAIGVGNKKLRHHFEYNPLLSFMKPPGIGSSKEPRVFRGAQVLNPVGVRLLWDSDDETGSGGDEGRTGDKYYDGGDNHGADGGNVVYVDGHHQWWNGTVYKGDEELDPDPNPGG